MVPYARVVIGGRLQLEIAFIHEIQHTTRSA
jgi:hypothetical protein